MSNTPDLKLKIHQACLRFIETRLETYLASYTSSLEAGNADSKSSAGDKHETGKAMAQLEQEKAAHQLAEAQKLKEVLAKINPNTKLQAIAPGSLVNTNNGLFYMAIGIGKLEVEGNKVFVISPQSPLGSVLLGKQKGATVSYNSLSYSIRSIL